jgi:5-formyltetrahydrofolate cyclo-ligase
LYIKQVYFTLAMAFPPIEESLGRSTAWGDRNPTKEQLRQRIWTQLQQQGAAKGDPFGHIPNFVGAEAAAERLAALPIWQAARVVKCNPDSPQMAVRLRALAEGKRLYMAVPQLRQLECFVEVTAAALAAKQVPLAEGATMAGALRHGKPVRFEAMRGIDLVLVGCVAVTARGGRTGKGAGFADLELAMLGEFGLVQRETAIATTVHGLQLVAETELEMQKHDWPLDWIVTPERVIETRTALPRPSGLDWETVQADQLAQIPILQRLRKGSILAGE